MSQNQPRKAATVKSREKTSPPSKKEPDITEATPIAEHTTSEPPKMKEQKTIEPQKPNPTGSVSEGFIPKKGERLLYHLRIWRKAKFDPETGKRLSEETIRAMELGEYQQFIENAERIGYEYKVLWNPSCYL